MNKFFVVYTNDNGEPAVAVCQNTRDLSAFLRAEKLTQFATVTETATFDEEGEVESVGKFSSGYFDDWSGLTCLIIEGVAIVPKPKTVITEWSVE